SPLRLREVGGKQKKTAQEKHQNPNGRLGFNPYMSNFQNKEAKKRLPRKKINQVRKNFFSGEKHKIG
ncbi:MAG: hypothetical protein ACI3X4_00300, partial [Bacteroidaceae bacterium]